MTNRVNPQPATPPVPKFDKHTAQRFLAHILDTSAGVMEIRLFRAWRNPKTRYIVPSDLVSATMAGWFDNVNDAVVALGALQGVSAYITINPVNPDLFARCANELKKQRNTTSDADIVVFRWLYIDIDPKRPADISSTDEELAAAIEVRDRILAAHPQIIDSAIWGCSGNGAYILVMLPDYLPEEGHDLAVQALAWISATYSTEAVKIDVSTKNPSRVGCIPGTAKCKGSNIPGRPWRLATMDSPDRNPVEIPPCDLRAWIEAVGADQIKAEAAQPGRKRKGEAGANGNGHAIGEANGHANGHHRIDEEFPYEVRLRRARAYIFSAGLPDSVAGDGGHKILYRVACILVDDFGLDRGDAIALLMEWNLAKGKPPESEQQIVHKVDQAIKNHPVASLKKLREGQRESNGVSHAATTEGQADHVINVPPTTGKKSSMVQVTPLELAVNDSVADHLHEHRGLYQRNYRLVEVATETREHHRHQQGAVPPGMPTIVPLALSRLREIVSAVVTFRSGVKVVHPPDWCVSAILHRQKWPKVPTLRGIVEHPIMRHDGSITNVAGYDEETEILCVSDDTFIPPPDHPGREDARDAARRLMAIVAEFPFHRDPDFEGDYSSHQAAWLACLMTILLRHLIDDAVPLFLIEATAAGSGKTLLCDLISRIVTGRDMVRSAYYHDPIEMDKRITSTAMGGIRVTLMDNVSGAFGNSALDNALTARLYQGRMLGQLSMTAPLTLDTVFMATGNNLSFHGDLFRRIVPCRLESPYERPDKDKTDFAIKDIRRHVIENRAHLLRDAFTIARAYIQAGRPYEPLAANTYGDWVRLIQGMIVWILDVDPLEGQDELAEADVFRASRAALIEGFAEMLLDLHKTKMTSGQIISALKNESFSGQFDIMREGIAGLWSHELPSSGSLGKRLMNMRNARIGDYKLIKAGMNKRAVEWTLQQIDPATGKWGTLYSKVVGVGTNEPIREITSQDLCSGVRMDTNGDSDAPTEPISPTEEAELSNWTFD